MHINFNENIQVCNNAPHQKKSIAQYSPRKLNPFEKYPPLMIREEKGQRIQSIKGGEEHYLLYKEPEDSDTGEEPIFRTYHNTNKRRRKIEVKNLV